MKDANVQEKQTSYRHQEEEKQKVQMNGQNCHHLLALHNHWEWRNQEAEVEGSNSSNLHILHWHWEGGK